MRANSPQKVFRFCPRCGSEGFHPEAVNMLLCGACGLEYFINPVMAVSGIIKDDEGRILLVRRAHDPMKGMLDLPGGFVELDETAEDALKREIKEELGIGIDGYEYFMSRTNDYYFGGITYFTIELAFTCRTDDLSNISISDEIGEYLMAMPGEIRFEEIAFPSTKSILETYAGTRSGLDSKS